MHHDWTPPFRFRTPTGWPTPSDEWIELHQGADPVAGWTPAPGVPAAPDGWAFWRTDPSAFRDYLPPAARRLRIVLAAALAVAVVAFVAVLILVAVDGPAVLGLVPLVAGVAVLTVAAVRLADLRSSTAGLIRDDAARWRRTELPARARAARPELDDAAAVSAWEAGAWGLATAWPFVPASSASEAGVAPWPGAVHRPPVAPESFRRTARRAVGLTAGTAAFLLVIGATAAVAPVVSAFQDRPGQTLATGLQDDDADPSDGPAAPWVSDDGTITASAVEDDLTWEATCGTGDSDASCWAWTIEGQCDGPAEVRIGFSDTQTGEDVRQRIRTVELTSGTPLVLLETGDEEWSSVLQIACTADADPVLDVETTPLDSDEEEADGSWPDGCVDVGCAGWELTSANDCGSATVQFAVDEEVGDLPDPHDLVVTTAMEAGEPLDVWAGGGWSSDSDAELVAVTCH